jgi:purine-binding chemotaxis protein CheW
VRIGEQMVGLLVDAVCDILTITQDMLQPTPDVACDSVKAFVKGIMAIEGRMISLISLDRVLPSLEAEAA